MKSVAIPIRFAIVCVLATIVVALPFSKAMAQPPVVTSIDPNFGHQGEPNINLTITGENFQAGAQVFFENPGIQIDGPVIVLNSTTIELVIDIDLGAPLGLCDVFVINPDTLQGVLVDGFTVIGPEPPIITGVVPDAGYTGDAGLAVTIQGSLLYTVTSVDFGVGITVDSIDYIDSDQVDCTISIDWLTVPGMRTVSVDGIAGPDSMVDAFEVLAYPPPLITGVFPDWDYQDVMGLALAVTGTGFLDCIDFEFLPAGNVVITNIQFVGSTLVNLTVDIDIAAIPQMYDLLGWHLDTQEGTLPNAFEVRIPPPEITGIDPIQGYQGDIDIPIEIVGTYLATVTTIDVGPLVVVDNIIAGPNLITAEMDIDPAAAPGPRDVSVSGPWGGNALINGFEVLEPPPIIDGVFPGSGTRGDTAIPVQITGQNLQNVDTVDFGAGITVSNIVAVESEINVELDIDIDADIGFRDVYVSAYTGGDTFPNGFEVLIGPVELLNIFPTQGARGDAGLAITVQGYNLDNINFADFGIDIIVDSVMVVSSMQVDVQITIEWDAALGFRDVTLLGIDGEDTLFGAFEVLIGEVQIAFVDPNQGYQEDTNLPVTIYGFNLDNINSVSFGSGITVAVMSVDSTQVDVEIDIDQLADPGFRDVTVFGLDGMDTLPMCFEVLPSGPIIIDVDPIQGAQGSVDLEIIISGYQFEAGADVEFSNLDITVNAAFVLSQLVIQCYIDIPLDASLGFCDVTVINPDLQDNTFVDGFEVIEHGIIPPEIYSLDPIEAYQGDTDVQITFTGAWFQEGLVVEFDNIGIFVVSIGPVTDSQFDVFIDIDELAPFGFCDVTVRNPDTGEDILPNGFEVLELIILEPWIDAIIPDEGIQNETIIVQVVGGEFQAGAELQFEDDGVPADSFFDIFVDVTSPSLIEGYVTIHEDCPPGYYDVRVTNPDTITAVLVDGFLVHEPIPVPWIDAIVPDEGFQGDTLAVQVLGGEFQPGAELQFEDDGFPAGSFFDVFVDMMSFGLMEGEVVIHWDCPPGYYDVRVTNPDTTTAVLEDCFLVVEPWIDAIVPDEGVQGDTLLVQVQGGGFQSGAELHFEDGGSPADSFFDVFVDVMSSSWMEGEVAIHWDCPPGYYDVRVTNPDTTTAILEDCFLVVEPWIDAIVPGEGIQGDTLSVQVQGGGFQSGAELQFEDDGVPADSFFDVFVDVMSPGWMEGEVAIHWDCPLGYYDVRVTNPDATTAVLEDGFLVVESWIDAIVPDEGVQGDTLSVQVLGGGFQSGAELQFEDDGFPADSFFDVFVDVMSPGLMEGDVFIHWDCPPGYYDVRVTNPDATTAVLEDAFLVHELIVEPWIDAIVPDEGIQCEMLSVQVLGGRFLSGAELRFEDDGFPADSFFDVYVDVTSSSLMEGDVVIHEDCPPGYYDLRVTNLDTTTTVLEDGFLVLEFALPPPEVTGIFPLEVCIGDVDIPITIYGANFQNGATVSFEYLDYRVYDAPTTFIDSTTLECLISVSEDAPEGMYTVRVDNPDGQYAYGPQLAVLQCIEPVGNLEWEESYLDAFISVDEGEVMIETEVIAHLLNTGEAAYEDVVVAVTDLLEADGRALTPEHVQTYPSFISPMDPGQRETISITLNIPVGGDLMPFGGSGVFLGSIIAQDTVTGDMASIPVSITIIAPGLEFVEIDPRCLQVDLLAPGSSADFVINRFYQDDGIGLSGVDIVDPFPIFEWTSYASDCPGYMEYWQPVYALTLVKHYPGQTPEDAISNVPVWEVDGLDDSFIQYSLAAEHLEGLYLWQIRAIPEPIPGTGVEVGPLTEVYSEIWAFVVESLEVIPPPVPAEGDLLWVPPSYQLEGCGMVPATLVISEGMINEITPETSFQLTLRDVDTGDELILDLDFADVQFSSFNPRPDFGPAAITFGFNLTVTGEVGSGMGPSGYSIQIWNGGILLGEMELAENSEGDFEVDAFVEHYAAFLQYLDYELAHDLECYLTWVYWWELQQMLADDCEEEWEAFLEAADNMDQAQAAFDEALDEFLGALEVFVDALIDEQEAQQNLENARQACRDFFANSVFSNDVSFSDPGEGGWNYVEGFGGEVGVWFRGEGGAGVLNTFLEMFGDEYRELWDNLREAEEAAENTGQAADEAENAVDEASEAYGEASDNLDTAQDAYDAALDALPECLEEMGDIQAMIDLLEFLYDDCFEETPGGTSSGLGSGPDSEGGDGPPVGGSAGEGEEGDLGGFPRYWPPIYGWPGGWSDSGAGGGTSEEQCPCGDLDDDIRLIMAEIRATTEAKQRLRELIRELSEWIRDQMEAGEEEIDVQQVLDDAQDAFDSTRSELSTFMTTHVFSNEVSGDPSTGPNYVSYRGLDIYFSNHEVFRSIFETIQPWIDEIADRHEANEDALNAARASLAAARAAVLAAQANVSHARARVTNAEIEAAATEAAATFARTRFDDRFRDVNNCRLRNGCPLLDFPEGLFEEEGAGAVADVGPVAPGAIPGLGQPTGRPAGPGVGGVESPCGDCGVEFRVLQDAEDSLEGAHAALQTAWDNNSEATQNMAEAVAQLAAAEETVRLLSEALRGIDSQVPDAEEQRIVLQEQLKWAEMLRDIAEVVHNTAVADLNAGEEAMSRAMAVVELAQEALEQTDRAYSGCMQRLRDCEGNLGLPSSEAPGGGDFGGYDVPAIPEGWGWTAGEGFEPWGSGRGTIPAPGDLGGEITDGEPTLEEGESVVGPCPCKDCCDELTALNQAEVEKGLYSAAWDIAKAELDAAREAYVDGQVAHSRAARKVEEAQSTVDKLQNELNNFMANNVNTKGVGGTSSSGIHHITYNGVTIYFNSYSELKAVLDQIKAAIDKLTEQLNKAKAELAAAQAALQQAVDALPGLREAYLTAISTEREAFRAYIDAIKAYYKALKAYQDCLAARKKCIEDHPEECRGESVEPESAGVGSSGGAEGKQLTELVSAAIIDIPGEDTLRVLENMISEQEEALGSALAEVADAANRVVCARVAIEEAERAFEADKEEMRRITRELGEWNERVEELISGMPDGMALMSYGPTNSVVIPDEEGLSPDERAWLETHFEFGPGIETWELLSGPPDDTHEYCIDRLAEALFEYQNAAGERAGAEARVEFIEEELQSLTEEIEGRMSELEDSLAEAEGVLEEILTLQAG